MGRQTMVRMTIAGVAALAFGAALSGSPWPAAAAAVLAVAAYVLIARSSSASRQDRPHAVRIPASSDPQVVIDAVQRASEDAVGSVAASLWLEDAASGSLRVVAAAGPMAPGRQPVPIADTVLGRALESGEAVLDREMDVRDADGHSALWRFAVPVGGAGARGVTAIDVRSVEAPDAARLTTLTASMRGALHGALFLHVARAETKTAHELIAAARDLSRRLGAQDVVDRSLDRAMHIADAATGSVMLVDAETGHMRIAAAEGLPPGVVEDAEVAEGEGIAGWVLHTRSAVLVEDLPGRPSTSRHGVRSAVSVPIADEDGILGVLNVGSRTYPARFTDDHLKALETLATQTAIALRNARAMESSRELYFSSITALMTALETKDPYARGTTGRVADLAVALGETMRLSGVEMESLRAAALLHDIGMTAIGANPASSSRPLSTVDRGLLKAHPGVAAEILREIPAMETVVPIVYHHHEWFDGHGYVGGLSGEDIPRGSRILAVADAFVAMTTSRPYRGARSLGAALEELRDKAGTQFDPEVVEALELLLRTRPEVVVPAPE